MYIGYALSHWCKLRSVQQWLSENAYSDFELLPAECALCCWSESLHFNGPHHCYHHRGRKRYNAHCAAQPSVDECASCLHMYKTSAGLLCPL